MAGKKDKARRYLRWAALNERRAAEAYTTISKRCFSKLLRNTATWQNK
jgi:hypothetical protein